MMLICGQSNRIWHYWAGRYPGSVGVLIGPSYRRKVPIDPWMPFVLDNDAFIAYRDKTQWDEAAWLSMIGWVRMTGQAPLWAAVPDVVGNAEETIHRWKKYAWRIKSIGWKTAFCVQDGMTPSDVPSQADVVFVGGTDRWKFPNLHLWTSRFPHVHCARVNAPEMIEACYRLGCRSIDGTGWFREPSREDKLPAIQRFIEGHRSPQLGFAYDTCAPTGPTYPRLHRGHPQNLAAADEGSQVVQSPAAQGRAKETLGVAVRNSDL